MTIIKAAKKHTETLMNLRREFIWFHDSLAGRKKSSGWEREYVKKLKADMASKKILKLVAVDDGNIVGVAFCELKPAAPGTGVWMESRMTGIIYNVYIRKEYRGRGIGTRLFNGCFKWLKKKKAGLVELMVAINNDKAHNLYKKLGFKDRSIRMTKRLINS